MGRGKVHPLKRVSGELSTFSKKTGGNVLPLPTAGGIVLPNEFQQGEMSRRGWGEGNVRIPCFEFAKLLTKTFGTFQENYLVILWQKYATMGTLFCILIHQCGCGCLGVIMRRCQEDVNKPTDNRVLIIIYTSYFFYQKIDVALKDAPCLA